MRERLPQLWDDVAVNDRIWPRNSVDSGFLARCTPRNQTQTPTKRRYVCIACNTQTLDIAS